MYTEKDIKEYFSQRGEVEMELGIYQAKYHHREDSMPTEMKERIDQIERNLMMIDSCFHALTVNERFVIQLHVVDQLDWPQVLGEYIKQWGEDSEKTIRSLQIYQTKALKKVAHVFNQKLDFQCISIQ